MTIYKILEELAHSRFPNYVVFKSSNDNFPNLITMEDELYIYDNEETYAKVNLNDILEIIRQEITYEII